MWGRLPARKKKLSRCARRRLRSCLRPLRCGVMTAGPDGKP
jgi:hypothetical protein